MWRTGEIEAQVEVESREPGSGQDVDEEGKRSAQEGPRARTW